MMNVFFVGLFAAVQASSTFEASVPDCSKDFSKYPDCQGGINWMKANWDNPKYSYKEKGVDGSECSIQKYMHKFDKDRNGGPKCPACECVDCAYSSWSSWSTCSATCGTGQQTRTRRSRYPASSCPDTTDTQGCVANEVCPVPNNPMHIKYDRVRANNYYLTIGDYGADPGGIASGDWAHVGGTGGCVARVVEKMRQYVVKQKAARKTLLFVALLGDNFYSTGLQDAKHFQEQFINIFQPTSSSSVFYGVPFLAVMGNHDMGRHDPGCACGKKVCKQFDRHPDRPSNGHLFHMPDYNWQYSIDEIGFEVIGLDTNYQMHSDAVGGYPGCDWKLHNMRPDATCEECGGFENINRYLRTVYKQGQGLIRQRAQQTRAKTVMIMQHYPGAVYPIDKLWNSVKPRGTELIQAFGHNHDQGCYRGLQGHGGNTTKCDVILSGGGGGARFHYPYKPSGGGYFGFAAVHLTEDSYYTVTQTPEVRFPQRDCWYD